MKVLVLALLAAVALSASASTIQKPVHPIFIRNGQRWDPVGEVEAALEKLVATVGGAIKSAKAEVMEILAEVNAFYANLKTATQEQISKLVDDAVADLANTINVPEEVLQRCVDESGIELIPVNLIDDLVHCATDKIDQIVKNVNDIVANIDRAIDVVTHFKSRLDGCGWDVVCYADLIYDVGSAAIAVPINIAREVADISMLVSTLVPSLETCAATQVAEAGILIAADVAKIIICTEQGTK